jgi:hypothetical protein
VARYAAANAGRWCPVTDKATSDPWRKNAVIYCADVATWPLGISGFRGLEARCHARKA